VDRTDIAIETRPLKRQKISEQRNSAVNEDTLDIDAFLSKPTVRERRASEMSSEIFDILFKPTVKEKMLTEKVSSPSCFIR
jgi:recombinational DNA repair protein RecT